MLPNLPPGIYPYKVLFTGGLMSKVTGQVFKVYDKDFRGKKLYSVKLEDDPIYYRMNENRHAGVVESGAFIEFDAEPNSDGKSATVKSAPKVVAPPQSTAAAPASGGLSVGREASIHYQSARKDALTIVGLAISSGAVKLPAAAAKKLKALEALVDSYTASYYEDIATGGAISRATAAAYADEQGPEETVEDEDE